MEEDLIRFKRVMDNYNIHDTTTFSDIFNYLLESESLPPPLSTTFYLHCLSLFQLYFTRSL